MTDGTGRDGGMQQTPSGPFAGYVAVPGSARTMPPGAQVEGSVGPNERVRVSIYLRPLSKAPVPPSTLLDRPLTREELAVRRGADPVELARVEDFARANGLRVLDTSAARRVVAVEGTAAQVADAFKVDLLRMRSGDRTFRGRTGPIYVPDELGDIVEGVFGLDTRVQARSQMRVYRPPNTPGVVADPRAIAAQYTPVEVARLYDIPTAADNPDGLDGTGQTLALIELGGGYLTSDLRRYFATLGLTPPTVVSVPVDGGANHPTGDASGPDGEVMLDIEVAGALAPRATIAVYFAPNTDQGFLDAVTAAIHDTTYRPSIISISWGAPESAWTDQAIRAMDAVFGDAAALGVTVLCAAGDNGSTDGVNDGRQHVDFPASSPFALACGGTRLETTATGQPSETVWNEATGGATGGGISDVFALPDYQRGAGVPMSANPDARVGRGVPDVAANADPATGYTVEVDGRTFAIGGTSAVAPLWAGLLALANQRLGRPVGYLHPILYRRLAGIDALRDVTDGNNGAYVAAPGWDPCTGLGTPDGARLIAALQTVATSGGGTGDGTGAQGEPLA